MSGGVKRLVADVRRLAAAAGRLASAPALGVLLAPSPASACASCLSGGAAARWAYYGTTILLMLLPFAIAALAVWWLRRAAREQAPRAARESAGEGLPAAR